MAVTRSQTLLQGSQSPPAESRRPSSRVNSTKDVLKRLSNTERRQSSRLNPNLKTLNTSAPTTSAPKRIECDFEQYTREEFKKKYSTKMNSMMKALIEQCKGGIYKDYLKESLEIADHVFLAHTKNEMKKKLCAFVFLRTPPMKKGKNAYNICELDLICSNMFHGRKIASVAENFCKNLGYNHIELHALSTAKDRYKQWGYLESSSPCADDPPIKPRLIRSQRYDPTADIDNMGWRMGKCLNKPISNKPSNQKSSKQQTKQPDSRFTTPNIEALKGKFTSLSLK